MQGGNAPVSVVDVYHALASCPAGMKPIPVSDGSAEMRAPPVVLVLHDNSGPVQIAPTSFFLIPHVSANSDPEKGPIGPEQPAKLVFHFRLPPGFSRAPIPAANVQVEQGDELPVEAAPKQISLPPEFAGMDPGIWEGINPDAVNRGLRECFNKGKPQDGGNPKPEGE